MRTWHDADMGESVAAVRLDPIETEADLVRAWSVVLTRSRIRSLSLWAMFIRPDGNVVDPVEVFGELPNFSDDATADLYVSVCRQELDAMPDGSSASLVVVRPEGARVGSRDRAWLSTVSDAAYRWGIVTWPVHVMVGNRLHAA